MNVYCYNDETDYYENLSEFLADKKRFPEKFLIAVAENVGKVKNGKMTKDDLQKAIEQVYYNLARYGGDKNLKTFYVNVLRSLQEKVQNLKNFSV